MRSWRQLIDGIRWRTRTGAPWRDVPERVYDLFRRWQRDGTWARVLIQLQAEADAKGLITCDVNVNRLPGPPARRWSGEKGDLQKESPGGIFVEPADHGLARARGGLTGEIHLAVE